MLTDLDINETTGAVNRQGRIKLVMDGLGAQIIRPGWKSECYFTTGGVLVKNGTLLLANKAALAISQDATAIPLGDVELQGGRIGAIASDGSAIGSFYGGSLLWAGAGSLLFDVSATSCDLINFQGDFAKDSSLGMSDYLIEFVNLATATDGKQYKIVTFTGNTDFTADEFTSNAATFGKNATFSMDANNLYVVFNAVPEPAQVAGLLGVIALAVVWIRRRK